jgi:hypothetical protein
LDRRTRQSDTILDRIVSYVTVADPQHSLFGSKLGVLPERSGRGPAYVVVELPDGRRRSIRVSSTDRGKAVTAPPSKGSALPRISVRTLIPLTRHLNASLALLAEEVIRDDATSPSGSRCVAAAFSVPVSAVGKKPSTFVAGPAGRHAKADSADHRGTDTTRTGRCQRVQKGDGSC